ncbi:MAG: YciI family protein [Planktomarina sp.]
MIALICIDKENALHIRKETREAHLAYVTQTNVVKMGGPFLDDNGDMCGSLIIVDLPDMAAAESWAANDPYAKAGLFQSVTMKAWKQTI